MLEVVRVPFTPVGTTAVNVSVHIVEDNDRIADMYRKWLADKFTATVSYDGESAVKEIDNRVDVVLLDRDLPGISGDEVLQELRGRPTESYVISMLTAQDPKVELAELIVMSTFENQCRKKNSSPR